MPKYALLHDADLCVGCQACEVACKQEHDLPVGPRWIHVFPIGPEQKGNKIVLTFNSNRCMHCGKPPCIEACPVNAISKRPDGIVLINEELCIACEACIEACPFEAPQYNPIKETIQKCTLCVHRVDQGLKPACVQACQTGALVFGDFNEVAESWRTRKARKLAVR